MKSLEKDDLPIPFWTDTLYKYQWHLLAKITMEKNQIAWTKVMKTIGQDGAITAKRFSRVFALANPKIDRAFISTARHNRNRNDVPWQGQKSEHMGMLLHLAAMHANEFVIRDLLRMGVRKTVKNWYGNIPFDLLPRKASRSLRAELKP